MQKKKIFLSFTDKDKEKADQIEKYFTEYDDEVDIWRFDKSTGMVGKNTPEEIDKVFSESDYVLCIITEKFFKSQNTRQEAYTANDKGKLKMLYFEKISDETRDSHQMLMNVWGIELFRDHEEGLRKLRKNLKIPSHIQTIAKNQKKDNPFQVLRVDGKSPKSIANLFFEPNTEEYHSIIGPNAVIIEGGRGSGKTIILRSLEVISAIEKKGVSTFRESNLDHFGIYFRVHRGAVTVSHESEFNKISETLRDTLCIDDLNLQFVESLIENLEHCKIKKKLPFSPKKEETICKDIVTKLKPQEQNSNVTDFQSLKKWIDSNKSTIRQYICSVSMGKTPEYTGCISEWKAFKEICKLLGKNFDDLENVKFVLLIDEYESFLPYQQKIVNSLIKQSDYILTVKIATKFNGIYTKETMEGQPLQSKSDYKHVILDYDLSDKDKLKTYKELVVGICEKYLKNMGWTKTDIKELLEKGDDDKITKKDIEKEIDAMLSNKVRKKQYTKKERETCLAHYKHAAIYRILARARRKKNYSGFNTFVFLSSGIVRSFIHLCGTAFAMLPATQQSNKDKKIPPEIQTRAAYKISHAMLEKLALGEEHSGDVKQFVMDMGEIIRTRLLYDNNEPEAISISIEAEPKEFSGKLTNILDMSVRESVFHQKEDSQSIKPKNTTSHQPKTYILNRMYTPALGISYRARWRTLYKVIDMNELVSDNNRSIKKRMMSEIKQRKRRRGGHNTLERYNGA